MTINQTKFTAKTEQKSKFVQYFSTEHLYTTIEYLTLSLSSRRPRPTRLHTAKVIDESCSLHIGVIYWEWENIVD